jgi:hypothetical protein
MKEHIEKEIKEGIRPSAPITTSASAQVPSSPSALSPCILWLTCVCVCVMSCVAQGGGNQCRSEG